MASDDGLLSRADAAIRGQLPANNKAAIKFINVVADGIEAVCELDPPERQKAHGTVGELLPTVKTDQDLDEVLGVLERLRQERQAALEKGPSTDQPDDSEGPSCRRTTTSQG